MCSLLSEKIPNPYCAPSSKLAVAIRVLVANIVTIWTSTHVNLPRRIFIRITVTRRLRRPMLIGISRSWSLCWSRKKESVLRPPRRLCASISWMLLRRNVTDGSGNVPTVMSMSLCLPAITPSCKYRHALPEGYVYKSRAEREAEAALREQDRNIDRNMMRLENIEMLVCDWGCYVTAWMILWFWNWLSLACQTSSW